MYDDI